MPVWASRSAGPATPGEVSGAFWQGWSHPEALSIVVPGLGTGFVPADAGSATVDIEGDEACEVRITGWSHPQASSVLLIAPHRVRRRAWRRGERCAPSGR